MFDLPLSRRDLFKWSAAGAAAISTSGWFDRLAVHAAAQTRTKACILLWMDGGPSHKDTFDLKPGTDNGGPYKPIQTSVPGIEISEYFPKFATLTQHAAILRGMSTGEGAHGRAKYYLHTGYKEGVGGLKYPSIGSIVSAELGQEGFPLPNFVSVGNRSYGSGFLGPKHQPLVIGDPNRGVENLASAVAASQFDNRISLLDDLQKGFYKEYQADSIKAQESTYKAAVTLMKSDMRKAFDLSLEPAANKAAYGAGRFGESCLLARRLVEVGVPFVEVNLGGWDTHNNNFERVKQLSGQVDPALSQLVIDLKQRGLLDSTLVIWMGDFGRTPKINSRPPVPGRDHYPRAWSSVMVGGGLKGGQVIGKTDADGATVVERPISTLDFMSTVCRLLGINYDKKNETASGRPIRIVDKGANPINELL